ncbi:MAG: hypothetical protein Q4F60_01495 [Candidatus Saccharibacteria bacterium]|nr:hypothetical protein [Candidatus Saccharibacteria bacterium]
MKVKKNRLTGLGGFLGRVRSRESFRRWRAMGAIGMIGVILLSAVANTTAGIFEVKAITSTYDEVKSEPDVLERMADLDISYYSPCKGGSGASENKNCGTPSGSEVVWVGDSYTVEAQSMYNLISGKLSGADIYGQVSRNTAGSHTGNCSDADIVGEKFTDGGNCNVDGLTVVQNLVNDGKMRKYLVFVLGTNPLGATADNFKKLAQIVGDGTKIVLMTAWTAEANAASEFATGNAAVKQVANDMANVVVADWEAASKGKESEYWGAGDSMHPNEKGYGAWVDTITGALGGLGGECSGGAGSCSELATLRKAVWDAASQEDKERFNEVAIEENGGSVAIIEAYLNQIISKYGSNGTMSDWLNGQCNNYRPTDCSGRTPISAENQAEIDKALGGSNYTGFAIGNSSEEVSVGKVSCVWKDGACRTDIDYDSFQAGVACNVISPEGGECFGDEGKSAWVNEMKSKCGGGATAKSDSSLVADTDSASTDGGSMSEDEKAEYVWNAVDKFMTNHNINLGGGEKAAVIAGVLGNVMGESGADPFSNGSCVGLFQDCGAQAQKTRDAVNAAVGGDYWGKTGVSKDIIQKAIDTEVELELSLSGGNDFFSNLDKPSAKSGVEGAKAYAELFLVTVERAVASDACVGGTSGINPSALSDSGVISFQKTVYSGSPGCQGVPYQGTESRRQHAETFYNKLKNGITGASSSGASGGACCATTGGTTAGAASGDVGALQAKAKEFVWKVSEQAVHSGALDAKEAYKTAWEKNGRRSDVSDCGSYVYNLMLESGWDPDFDQVNEGWAKGSSNGGIGAGLYGNYMEKSSKWVRVDPIPSKKEDWQPGDVFVRSNGSSDHIGVYVGDLGDDYGDGFTDAAFTMHSPFANSSTQKTYSGGWLNDYRVYRKSGVENSDGSKTTITKNAVNTAGGTVADLQAVAQKYAWGKEKADAATTEQKAEYRDIIAKKYPEEKLHMAGNPRGNDCAAWVRFLMVESGWDPGMAPDSRLTKTMDYWKKNSDKWKKIDAKSADDLQPGDVLAYEGHVLAYVGKISGFSDTGFVSASNGSNKWAPQADWEKVNMSKYDIYRMEGHAMGSVTTDNGCGGSSTTTNNQNSNNGLTESDAQKIVDDYNANYATSPAKSVADGPANCFALSVWWLMKYTDLDYKVYAEKGHAAEFVHNLATKQGVKYGSEPQVYSIFSTDNYNSSSLDGSGEKYGHTGIVVGIDGDMLTVIEAGAGFGKGVVTKQVKKSEFTNSQYSGYEFAYINDHMKTDELNKVLGR